MSKGNSWESYYQEYRDRPEKFTRPIDDGVVIAGIFKAITTAEKFLIEDPENMINYQHHGKPCEMRGGGIYPTTDFWDFYDEIRDEKLQERYPIPDTQSREKFIKENF